MLDLAHPTASDAVDHAVDELPAALRQQVRAVPGISPDVEQLLADGDVSRAVVRLRPDSEIPAALLAALGDWYLERDLLSFAAAAYLISDIRPRILRFVNELCRRGRYDEASTVCARLGEDVQMESVALYAHLAAQRGELLDARAKERLRNTGTPEPRPS